MNKFDIKAMQFDQVTRLAEFKRIREVEFYKLKDVDSIGVIHSVFPAWELEPAGNSKTKYRLVSNPDPAG